MRRDWGRVEQIIDGLLCALAIIGIIAVASIVALRILDEPGIESEAPPQIYPPRPETVTTPPPSETSEIEAAVAYIGPLEYVPVAMPEITIPAATATPQEETQATSYSVEDLAILANTVYYEARGCSNRMQQLVAAVVLNRVGDPRYADTISGVVSQRGQYGSGNYAQDLPDEETAGREMQRCFSNAREALAGNVECPDNVIFQAEFRQGTGTYEQLTAPWGTTLYFCYG